MFKVVQAIPNGKEVAALREKMGLIQAQLADLFGVSLRQWQRKESMDSALSNSKAPTKVGETNLLYLLADAHPYYRLQAFHSDALIRTTPAPRKRCGSCALRAA